MSTRESLLAGIRDDPDDDTLRSIYADWLEDNGDPDRAEFIRVQLRLAALPAWNPARFDLEEREQDLLAEHRAAWMAHLPKWARQLELRFRRGLLDEAQPTTSAYLRYGERLARLLPLRKVSLQGYVDRPEEVARLPATARLSELDTTGMSSDAPVQRRFFDNLHAPRLRRLTFSGGVVQLPGLPAVLIGWPGLAQLTGLGISTMPYGDYLAELFASPRLGRLEWLDLSYTDIGPATCAALARQEKLNGLRYLDVSSCGLGAGGAHALAEAAWPALEELRLSPWLMNADDVRRLLSGAWMAGLRSLDLIGMRGGAEAGRVLAEARAGRLERLSVTHSSLGTGAAALADADLAAGLTTLSLGRNGLGDEVAVALARSPRLTRLTHLDLSDNGSLTADGVKALVESSTLSALRELHVSGGRSGHEGAGIIGELPGAARLRVLGLTQGKLGRSGVSALARSPYLKGLRRLHLDGCGLDFHGVSSLLKAAWLPSLRELDLRSNHLGDAGVAAVASCASLARLRVLSLGANGFGDAGAIALADSPHLNRLLRLEVSKRRLGRAVRDRLRERFGQALQLSS
jgi:uncharacterized protein (TIGR02996 family)